MWKKYKGSYLAYSLMYNFFYLSSALFSSLMSVQLLGRGYTNTQISFVSSCAMVSSLVLVPLMGMVGDRVKGSTLCTVVMSAAAVLGVFYGFTKSLAATALLYSLVVALTGSVTPNLERMAVTSPHPYGKIRFWGTIGWAIGVQLCGLIYQHISPTAVYYFYVLAALTAALGIAGTKNAESSETTSQKQTDKVSGDKKTNGIFSVRFVLYLLISGFFYVTISINSIYLPVMLNAEGFSVDFVSTVISISTLFQLPIIFWGGRLMNRFGNRTLLFITICPLLLQYAIYAFLPIPSVHMMVTLLFQNLSSMAFIMLNMKVVATIVREDRQLTALSFVSTFRSLITIPFQMLAGVLVDSTSYSVLYISLSVMILLTLLLVAVSRIPSGKSIQIYK